MKRMIRCKLDIDQPIRVNQDLERTLDISLNNEVAEWDGKYLEFASYDWASPIGEGEHDQTWDSNEEDPVIGVDDTSGVADKVEKLLMPSFSSMPNGNYSISCKANLSYWIENVKFSVVGPRGYFDRGEPVDFDKLDISWDKDESQLNDLTIDRVN